MSNYDEILSRMEQRYQELSGFVPAARSDLGLRLRVLAYEVDQILTVEPDETSALAVEDGEDLVTLLTCTPYGVNTHRLLVRGHRTAYEEDVVEAEETPLAMVSVHTSYLLWVCVGLAVTLIFIVILYLMDRRRRKARQKERKEQT